MEALGLARNSRHAATPVAETPVKIGETPPKKKSRNDWQILVPFWYCFITKGNTRGTT
jgi:hypothetical protein